MILSAGGSTSHHLNQGIHQDVCRRSGRTAGDASPGADHSTHAPGLKMGAFVSHSAFFFLHARWCEVCCRKGEEKSCCKSFNKATWGTTNSSTSKASWTLQRNALFTFIYIILLHFEDAKVASECDNRENWLSCSFANAFCSSSTLLTTNSIPGEMARHITIQSLEYMHRFSIFLWHTVTGAAQNWLLSALLGSYVLNTHSASRIYSAGLWPCPDCKSSIFHATPPCTCPFAAMSCEVQLNTLQGGVITLEVVMTATVRELKALLLEKHPCQDLIERKVLKVELLRDSSIIDDAETLDAAGLLGAETLVTVTYARNEVEASTKHDIHTQGCFGVKIPCNVTSISEAAFKNSHQLVLLTIPESVSHIGRDAFSNCTSLASITLGESVTHVGDGAFRNCTSLASITLGESVTHVGNYAFEWCSSLPSITLGESVTDIGDYAFDGCSSLASITLGESVTHVGNYAFDGCSSLPSITLGESVTRIGDYAFYGCTSLESITLGESVTQIGYGAFQGCTSLASITLGELVTHIGNGAFQNCPSLASVTLGESVTQIGDRAFALCTSLVNIALGESVTQIGYGAFLGCTSLVSIPLGESVTLIGECAFSQCTSLASITLGESVTHIGEGAFHGCTSLASITIPEALRHILTRALGSLSVAVITIPARQGRKRLREEWVSAQICSGANASMIGTICGKIVVPMALWRVMSCVNCGGLCKQRYILTSHNLGITRGRAFADHITYLAQEHYPAHSRMVASAANRFVKPSCLMLGISLMQTWSKGSKSCWNDESSFRFVDLEWCRNFMARYFLIMFTFLSCRHQVLLALICRSPPLFLGCSLFKLVFDLPSGKQR